MTGPPAAERLPRFDPAAWADDPADVMTAARSYADRHAARVGDLVPGHLAWAAYWSVCGDAALAEIADRLRDVQEATAMPRPDRPRPSDPALLLAVSMTDPYEHDPTPADDPAGLMNYNL